MEQKDPRLKKQTPAAYRSEEALGAYRELFCSGAEENSSKSDKQIVLNSQSFIAFIASKPCSCLLQLCFFQHLSK